MTKTDRKIPGDVIAASVIIVWNGFCNQEFAVAVYIVTSHLLRVNNPFFDTGSSDLFAEGAEVGPALLMDRYRMAQPGSISYFDLEVVTSLLLSPCILKLFPAIYLIRQS